MFKKNVKKITSKIGKYLRPNLTPLTEIFEAAMGIGALSTTNSDLRYLFLILGISFYLGDRMGYDGYSLDKELRERLRERREKLLQIPYLKALPRYQILLYNALS